MQKFLIAVLIAGAAGLAFRFVLLTTADAGAVANPSNQESTGPSLVFARASVGGPRFPAGPESTVPQLDLSSRWKAPTSASELQEFVAWLRSLPESELRDLSNSSFGFRESALVDMLRALDAPWVVPELGDLATEERDPLVKAVLVMGFLGAPDESRSADPRIVDRCAKLLTQLTKSADDPFDVGFKVITRLKDICFAQSIDYTGRTAELLAGSDNSRLLIHGYFNMSPRGAGRVVLTEALGNHPSRDGRMGAIEALRYAASRGELSECEAAQVFAPALDGEPDRRNRSLLLEALASKGGAAGRAVMLDIANDIEHPLCGEAIEHIARDSSKAESLALAERVVAAPNVAQDVFSGACRALALLDERASKDRLVALAGQTTLDAAFRVESIRALSTVTGDTDVRARLSELLQTGDRSEVRIEALRALAATADERIGDLRVMASSDRDSGVRAEAIRHAAFAESPGASEWLAERARSDSDSAVRRAALEALTERAHLGDPSVDVHAEIRNHLTAATDPLEREQLAALLARAEAGDPRNAHFGLGRRAYVLRRAAAMLEGANAKEMTRAAERAEGHLSSIQSSFPR